MRERFPLWVKSRHFAVQSSCPLYPQERTLALHKSMSALCQKRTPSGESTQAMDVIRASSLRY